MKPFTSISIFICHIYTTKWILFRKLLLISVILSTTGFCHVEQDLKKCFYYKSLTQFKTLKEKLRSEGTEEKIEFRQFNDIIPGYQGGTIIIGQSSFIFLNPHISLNVICHHDSIIYYSFNKKDINPEDTSFIWRTFGKINPTYVNPAACNLLNIEFKKIFETDFTMNAFFEFHQFGSLCGPDGELPEMDSIVNFVKKINRPGIDQWLCSSNTTIQLYGLFALYLAEKKGLKINPREKQWKEVISEKNGIIETCSGCWSEGKTIKEIVAGFKDMGYQSKMK